MPGVSLGGQGTGLGALRVRWGNCIQTPPQQRKGTKLAMGKSPLEPGVGKVLLQGHMSPATRSPLEQDEPTPCLCHGEGPRGSACPQSLVLGEHRGPALL